MTKPDDLAWTSAEEQEEHGACCRAQCLQRSQPYVITLSTLAGSRKRSRRGQPSSPVFVQIRIQVVLIVGRICRGWMWRLGLGNDHEKSSEHFIHAELSWPLRFLSAVSVSAVTTGISPVRAEYWQHVSFIAGGLFIGGAISIGTRQPDARGDSRREITSGPMT